MKKGESSIRSLWDNEPTTKTKGLLRSGGVSFARVEQRLQQKPRGLGRRTDSGAVEEKLNAGNLVSQEER